LAEEAGIGEAADGAEWGGPSDGVAHERAGGVREEFVRVAEGAEGAGDHLVCHAVRRIEFGYFDDEDLLDDERAAFKADALAEGEFAVVNGERFGVQARIADKREARIRRRIDDGLENEFGHGNIISRCAAWSTWAQVLDAAEVPWPDMRNSPNSPGHFRFLCRYPVAVYLRIRRDQTWSSTQLPSAALMRYSEPFFSMV
jgi:hypothetical protein